MKRTAPKRIRRRPPAGPYAPGFDEAAASRVARLVAMIRVEGEPTPLVEPIGDRADHADFDRELCGAGIRRFARPRLPSDWSMIPEDHPLAREGGTAPHVLVEQIAPGARRRLPLLVVMSHELN